MSVYVGPLRDHQPIGRLRITRTAHLLAESEAELERMAKLIGLRKDWRHGDHYDVSLAKRELAIQAGAIQATDRELVEVRRRVDRDGRIRTRVVEHVNADNLKKAIRDNVNQQAAIQTDELNLYRGIGQEFAGGHQTVNHSLGEYARGEVNTNTAESFFALLKRGVHGTFHHISKTHLHRYCNEFSFRWDERKVTDGERTVEAIRGAAGKRLVYREAVA